jgi:hypothetical protein
MISKHMWHAMLPKLHSAEERATCSQLIKLQICIVRGCSTSLLQSGVACRACEVQRMKCRPPVVVVVGDGLSMSLKENTVAFKHTCVAACGLWWWTTPTHSGSSSHLTHPAHTEFSGGAAIEARGSTCIQRCAGSGAKFISTRMLPIHRWGPSGVGLARRARGGTPGPASCPSVTCAVPVGPSAVGQHRRVCSPHASTCARPLCCWRVSKEAGVEQRGGAARSCPRGFSALTTGARGSPARSRHVWAHARPP